MVGAVRQGLGRNAKTTFLIVDAQSVKNTDTAEHKGFDGGKLISGIKRHIGVDTHGLPHAWDVTTADVTDRKGGYRLSSATMPILWKSRVSWPMALIRENLLPQACAKFWARQFKLPNAMNCTNLPYFPNVGSSSVLLPGSKSAADSGKTANVNSIPAAI